MSENLSLGNWIKPEDMKTFSETQLYDVMKLLAGGPRDAWARAELARRRDERISKLIESLTDVTTKVHHEVGVLSSSSDKLEKLTKRLIILTWALIGLTVIVGGGQIVVEVWKAYRP